MPFLNRDITKILNSCRHSLNISSITWISIKFLHVEKMKTKDSVYSNILKIYDLQKKISKPCIYLVLLDPHNKYLNR